jgi:hypothetical protein
MDIKVSIPTSLNDITIEQFQAINELAKRELCEEEESDEILKLFTGIEQVDAILQKDRDYLLSKVKEALIKEGTFKNRFTIGNIEFGMIPNFDKITGSEYTDLIKYFDKIEDLHKLMAVVFRPIKLKDVFKNYQIVNYNGTHELSELMKQTPMSVVKGFNGFFLTLSNDLKAYTLKSMEEAQAKAMAL